MVAITIGTLKTFSDTATSQKQAGESISVGDVVYKKSADSKHYAADANAGSAESTVVGIALTGASADGYFTCVTSGGLDLGATLTVGETYILGGTAAGDINPVGDRATGWYTSDLGFASEADKLQISIKNGGIAAA